MALGRIIKLNDQQMTDIFAQYPYISNSERQEIKAELESILLLQNAPDFPRIGSLDCERFRCELIDDIDGLNVIMEALYTFPKRLVAFDVEASYVCQSSSSSQELVLITYTYVKYNCSRAALLQLAIGSIVYLVDIYTLKKGLHQFDWEVFFEVFLRSRIRKFA